MEGGSPCRPAALLHASTPSRPCCRAVSYIAKPSSSMRLSSTSRLLLAAAATSGACCLALVLAVGVCTASAAAAGGRPPAAHAGRPRPPSPAVLGVDSLEEKDDFAADEAARDQQLLGAGAAGQDYGFVDPPPDTRRRGGTSPIPHN